MFQTSRGRLSSPLTTAVLLLVATLATAPAAEPQRLTRDGRLKFSPTFLPGGKQIVFSTHNVPNRVSLVRMNIADGKRELLYPSLTPHQFDADFSRDGRWHCFAMSATSPQMVLVIKDAKATGRGKPVDSGVKVMDKGNKPKPLDLGNAKVFKPQGARSTVRTPRILPDGSRIVFTLSAPGGQQIASVNMQAGDLKRLTKSTGTNCWPDVSPDGKWIVFASSRRGSFNLFLMEADGSGPRQLTATPLRDMRPVFSPDGRRIVFVSTRDGNHELYVMRLRDLAVVRVTHHDARDDFPAWHPDGRRLLFVSHRGGQSDLYLLDVPDGG